MHDSKLRSLWRSLHFYILNMQKVDNRSLDVGLRYFYWEENLILEYALRGIEKKGGKGTNIYCDMHRTPPSQNSGSVTAGRVQQGFFI